MTKPTRQREAPPFPYALPDRNPIDGEPWTLRDRALRDLLAHCLAEPAFAEPDNAGGLFVCRADLALRYYRAHRHRRMRDDPRRLRAIQTHAEALARAIEAIPADDPLHGLECWPWRTVRLPSPAELRAVADAAGGLLLVEKAIGGRGKRDRGPLVQRQALINALWDDYPAPLRSLALRGHFLESLGLILLGRRAGDPALRALQAEARRAREAVAAMALFHAEWLARSEPIT